MRKNSKNLGKIWAKIWKNAENSSFFDKYFYNFDNLNLLIFFELVAIIGQMSIMVKNLPYRVTTLRCF